MELYPFKFKPIFIDKLWGGDRLKMLLGKDCSERCGESWEISAVEGHVSQVINGSFRGRDLQSLIDEFKGQLVGERIFQKYGHEFPLLIKFLDANDDLSVQVHPNDEQARTRHGTRGKTEMWYVLEAEEDAKLIAGLNEGIDRAAYEHLFRQGKIMDAMKIEKVSSGDTFFIPAGKVHTIGKGILLAEVQETSDITYRIYDFDRVDINGKKRDLHIDEALEVINFKADPESRVLYDREKSVETMVSCEHFTTRRLQINKEELRDFSGLDSFVVYICTSGKIEFSYKNQSIQLAIGESLLIPACIQDMKLRPIEPSEVLEVYIES